MEVDESCIKDEEKQRAYLDPNSRYGTYLTYLYYNYETFDETEYDEQAF